MNEAAFYKKSILLTLTNLTTGILNFVFSVILSRKISAEGMGLYGLILPISNLLFSIMSGGLLIAVSKVIAEYHVKNKINNVKKCIRTTIYFNLLTSIFLISIAFLLSYQISVNLIKDIRALHALRFIFISIICMTLSNTYKGYFYGTTNVFVPAFIDIFEKLIRIILILIIQSLIL